VKYRVAGQCRSYARRRKVQSWTPVVFDCEKIQPNRFAFAVADAARSRALHWGAERRPRQPTQTRATSRYARSRRARSLRLSLQRLRRSRTKRSSSSRLLQNKAFTAALPRGIATPTSPSGRRSIDTANSVSLLIERARRTGRPGFSRSGRDVRARAALESERGSASS
jgi:hypothetical protein